MVAQIDKTYRKLPVRHILKRIFSYLLFEGRPLTTKGRFINPFLKFFYLLSYIISKLTSNKSAYTPVYILGTGRSGTTILGVALSSHSRVGFLNEPKLGWYFANNRDDIIGSYSKEVGKLELGREDANDSISQRIRSFYSTYSYLTNSSIVLDKYPEMIFRTEFIEKTLDTPKFILLARNGVDVVLSIGNWSLRKGIYDSQHGSDWWGKNDRKWQVFLDEKVINHSLLSKDYEKIVRYNCHQARAAVEWILTMEKLIELKKSNSNDYFFVKYENFVSDEVLRERLLEFLDLDIEESFRFYCKEALTVSKRNNELELPSEIVDVFNDLQIKLGYSDSARSK